MSRDKSILIHKAHVPPVLDGVANAININIRTDHPLGKQLTVLYPHKFKTFFGDIGCIKNFMDFISTEGYPFQYLAKTKLTKKEITNIPRPKLNLPNYWAAVAYAVTCRIKDDAKLIAELKANTLDFTSYIEKAPTSFLGSTVSASVPDMKASRYLSILRHIVELIKADKFTDSNIEQFIQDCRDDKTKHVFDGVPFDLKIDSTTQTEPAQAAE